MEVNNDSSDHLQECANGLRDLVAEGRLGAALKVATYLQKEGQLAILQMEKGELKDFYPKVTALLDTLENSNIDSHPKLRHTVAKTARVFAQLAVDRMGEPFPEDIKNGFLEKIAPRLEAAQVGKQFALRYELFCLREAVKGIDTGISLFNFSLAAGVIKGGVELATGNGPGTLLKLTKDALREMGAMWYPDALRLSWVGQMGKNDEGAFKFFCGQVDEYVDRRCKLVDLEKKHVLIGLVDTFAEIAWTSKLEKHQRTAALWVAKLANEKQKRTPLKAVCYRAVEQLMAMEGHHIESLSKLAALQLESFNRLSVVGNQNTGCRERPELVLPRRAIEQLLKSSVESKVEELHGDATANFNELLKRVEELKPQPRAKPERIVELRSPLLRFVGREREQERLAEILLPGDGWTRRTSCPVALIHGLAGMGKTELALRFINDHIDEFSLVWTIRADSEEQLNQSYRSLAREIGLGLQKEESNEHLRKRLFRYLSSQAWEKPYLLLYENAEKYCPLPTHGGAVLITAQNGNLFEEVEKIPLSLLSLEEALDLFSKWTERELTEEVRQLAEKLDRYPLLVAQAAAHIARCPTRGASDLLEGLKVYNLPSSTRYPLSFFQVFKVTLDRLESENPKAMEFLKICAYLHPDGIPLIFAQAFFVEGDHFYRENHVPHSEQVEALTRGKLLLYDAKDGCFSIHRFVQIAVRARDRGRQGLEGGLKVVNRVADLTPIGCEMLWYMHPIVFRAATLWAAHARQLLTDPRSEKKFPKQLPRLFCHFISYSVYIQRIGEGSGSALFQLASHAYSMFEQHFPNCPAETLAPAVILQGIARQMQGAWRDSEAIFEDAITFLLSKNSSSGLGMPEQTRRRHLMHVYERIGTAGLLERDYEQARVFFSLPLDGKFPILFDPDLQVWFLGRQFDVLWAMGLIDECRSCLVKAVDLWAENPLSDHSAANILSHVGRLVQNDGRIGEAIVYYKRALAASVRPGFDERFLVCLKFDLAMAYAKNGESGAAKVLFEEIRPFLSKMGLEGTKTAQAVLRRISSIEESLVMERGKKECSSKRVPSAEPSSSWSYLTWVAGGVAVVAAGLFFGSRAMRKDRN